MSSEKLRADKTCLNCNNQVEDVYCGHCGQKNVELHDNFIHLARHFIADYFHFDSKFRRSIRPLLFKPGYLPRLYLKGERASHINPVGTLIFLSAVFFIVFKSNDLSMNEKSRVDKAAYPGHIVTFTERDDDSILQQNVIDSLQGPVPYNAQTSTTTTGKVKHNLLARLSILGKSDEQREMFAEKMKHNFAKVVLALIPLLALILWLVYYRRKILYFDHLVMVVYAHCFMYMLLICGAFLSYMHLRLYGWLFLIIAVYIVIAMKNFYAQNWFKTIFKFCIVATFYTAFFVLGLLTDVVISLF